MATKHLWTVMHCDNVSLNANKTTLDMYLNEKSYDCTFLLENAAPDEKKLFRCNKQILSLASPVFEAMLCGGFSEAFKGPDDPIKIIAFSPSCFDQVMRFIYSKEIVKFSCLAQAVEVATFAHQWLIDYLFEIALEQFNLFEISYKECQQLYEIFNFYQDKVKARKYIQKFVDQHAGFFSSDYWFLAEKETVVNILLAEGYNTLDESSLFIALVQWGEYQVNSRGDEESAEATRAELSDLLPLIRFRALPVVQFDKLMNEKCSTVLSDFEKIAIRKCRSSGNDLHMPSGFSLKKESRSSMQYIYSIFSTTPDNIKNKIN